MPFKFKHLVLLLEDLDAARGDSRNVISWHQPKRVTPKLRPPRQIIQEWFRHHESNIVRHGPSGVALLSSLLLDRSPHRVYALQENRLASVMCKVLGLPEDRGRGLQLHQWQKTDMDFATCVEQVVADASFDCPTPDREVTLEEIHHALERLAERSSFDEKAYLLKPIFWRLHSSEAKWLVRMILKTYSPVEIPGHVVLGCFHFLLPQIIHFRNSLADAIEVLQIPELSSIPHDPPEELRHQYRQECARHVGPRLGVPLQRQEFLQARGIGHCCRTANQKTMSVERKYDGWYVQVHIDISKGKDRIRIFSKRSKNLTAAAWRLHDALEAGLRLDHPDCTITRSCILEGEMLVWSRKDRAIQPFCKIRKYVDINGRTIGTATDSPKSPDEQLMVVFYDCLLHDDRNLTFEPHRVRRQHLERIVDPVDGLAQVGDRHVINFGSPSGKKQLLEYFAYAIAERWEGLVLKGCEDFYFSAGWYSEAIKLKKDYIKGCGDRADLCVVGGRKDAADSEKLGRSLRWTTVHLACLKNKEDVVRYGAKPLYLLLAEIARPNIPEDMLLDLNRRGIGRWVPFTYESERMDIESGQSKLRSNPPTELFREPFIVEAIGAGFDKPGDVSYYTLRFPRIDKMHFDRGVTDTHSFDELQELARKSLEPASAEEQEEMEWYERLIQAEPKKNQHLYLPSQSQQTSSPSSASPFNTARRTPTPLAAESIGPIGQRVPPARPSQQAKLEQLADAELPPQSLSSTPTTTGKTNTTTQLGTLAVELRKQPASSSPLSNHVADGPPTKSTTSTSMPVPSAGTPTGVNRPAISLITPPQIRQTHADESSRGVKRKLSQSDSSPAATKRARPHTIRHPLNPLSTGTTRTATQSPTKIKPSTSMRQASALTKQRQPLAALENVSPTRGLHKAPTSPTKTSSARNNAKEHNTARNTGKAATTAASTAGGSQAPQPSPSRAPSHLQSYFPLDKTICTTLWPDSAEYIDAPEDPHHVYMVLVAARSSLSPTLIHDLRRRIFQAYRIHWNGRTRAADDERRDRRGTQGSRDDDARPAVKIQRRVILFYEDAVSLYLGRDTFSGTSTSSGAGAGTGTETGTNTGTKSSPRPRTIDIQSILPRPEMKRFFIRALVLTTRDDKEEVPRSRDISSWKEAMKLISDMPGVMYID
jgi:DNA ligase-4